MGSLSFRPPDWVENYWIPPFLITTQVGSFHVSYKSKFNLLCGATFDLLLKGSIYLTTAHQFHHSRLSLWFQLYQFLFGDCMLKSYLASFPYSGFSLFIIRCNYGASTAMLAQASAKGEETTVLFRLPVSLVPRVTVSQFNWVQNGHQMRMCISSQENK